MPELLPRLQRLLNPRVVAVVGDQRASGYRWLESLKTFHGRLYSVQGDAAEIPGIQERGIENVAGIAKIPEPVDYVVCAVPPKTAPAIVTDCIQAHVGGVALCTAGFAETADDVGIRLQDEIVTLARQGGLPLLGPNCLGLHIPRLGLRFSPQQPHGLSGSVGFITQSGSHGLNFSLEAAAGGVYCSALIAYGNGSVLDAADFMDGLAHDPDTRVIGLYIEGTRDGRRASLPPSAPPPSASRSSSGRVARRRPARAPRARTPLRRRATGRLGRWRSSRPAPSPWRAWTKCLTLSRPS